MEALGINLFNIIVYTVLFAVTYILLKRFLFPSLIKIIEKREEEVIQLAEDRKKLESNQQELIEKEENLTHANNLKLQKELEKNKQAIKKEREEIIFQAKQEAEEIIAKAKTQAQLEKEKAREEMQQLVEEAVNKVVKDIYKNNKMEIDKKMIASALNELS